MWVFLHDSGWFEITYVMRDFLTPKAERVSFTGVSDAKFYLFRFVHSANAMRTFREIVLNQWSHSVASVEVLRDDQIIDIIAEIFVRGGLKLGQSIQPAAYRGTWETSPENKENEVSEKPDPNETTTAPADSWIKIKIVDDETNKPVMGLGLDIRFPDGYESRFPVGVTGNIEVRAIASGRCGIGCNVDDVYIEDCFRFVKVGESPSGGKNASRKGKEQADKQGNHEAQKGTCIVDIQEHKVRDGETLTDLAEKNALTWEQLAYFNYGTKDLEQVNQGLQNIVGCSKKTEDGRTFQFQSTDDPGIVYVPKKWTLADLGTNNIHTIRVEKLKIKRDITLELKNNQGLEIPEAQYSIVFADGFEKKGQLDTKGIAIVSPTTPGPFSVTYLDHDDILAKSMAAAMSKELREKNIEKIIGLLTQPKKLLKDMLERYDKYFNTLSGNGLIEDLNDFANEEKVADVVEHLLVRADLKQDDKLTIVPWETPRYQ